MQENMHITVLLRDVYGTQTIYPVCDRARGFTRLLGQKTLTVDNLRDIKDIGFSITIKAPEPRSIAGL